MTLLNPISPTDLKRRLDSGEAILIDVRESDEHAREHILGAHTALGVPAPVVLAGVADALSRSEADHGVSSGLILTFLRHLPVVYVDYPGMVHGFFNMSAVIPTARSAITDAAKALRQAFGN